jgi:ABC-type uncharacterized transport system ATPase subunit
MKFAIFALIALTACGKLSQQQNQALFISCEAMRDLKNRQILLNLSYTEQEAVRASIYSNAIHALSGGNGAGPAAIPPSVCTY